MFNFVTLIFAGAVFMIAIKIAESTGSDTVTEVTFLVGLFLFVSVWVYVDWAEEKDYASYLEKKSAVG
jgi:hypothetical protein